MFGQYQDLDAATEAKADAIRSVGGFLGSLAHAIFSHPGRQAASARHMEGMPEPCLDAVPGEARPTPCERREAELREKAAAMRGARRR